MIKILDNSDKKVASDIFTVFQSSYKIEAQLVGGDILNFPPLLRCVENIQASSTTFYGFIEKDCIAGVIEIEKNEQQIDINSLTVSPDYFRKGIGGILINHVLKDIDFSTAVVETASGNLPAIHLYKKYGFVEFKKWTPSHGIEKVAMLINRST